MLQKQQEHNRVESLNCLWKYMERCLGKSRQNKGTRSPFSLIVLSVHRNGGTRPGSSGSRHLSFLMQLLQRQINEEGIVRVGGLPPAFARHWEDAMF